MALRLANKIAIITGSSSGIGRATALAFAKQGATVVCSDIRDEPRGLVAEGNLTTLQELEKMKAKTKFVKCDIRHAEEVEALVQSAVKEYGRLDIMMNNAGVGEQTAPVWDYDPAYFDKVVGINLTGVFLGTKYAAAQMKDQTPHSSGDRGWIINVASILGLNGTANTAGYVASKHGVMGLTKTAAWDCAPHRIHINALCPGYTETSMTKDLFDNSEIRARLEFMHPFRGLGTAEDLAKAAVFLASEDAQWVTGVGLPVDGGYGCM